MFKTCDETLREQLVPKYRFGCKRITPSDEYYDALSQPQVRIITSKITSVTANSILSEDGNEEKIDVKIVK
jgi:cation diffusion facilitator CzcD-associated flavoprotein CzcO